MSRLRMLVLFDQEGCIGISPNNTAATNTSLYQKQCLATINYIKSIYHNPELYICDCHFDGKALTKLSNVCTDTYFVSMPWNIDFSKEYSFAFLIGFHGMQGTKDPLAHSFRPEIARLCINRRVVGEVTSFFYLLCKYRIPTVFFSGSQYIKPEYQRHIHLGARESILHITSMKSHAKISQEYVSYFHAIHKTVSLETYSKMKVPKKFTISVSYNRKDISAYLTQAGFQTDFDDISDFIYSFKDSAIILNKYNQVFHNRLSYIRKAYINGFNQPLPPDIQRITKKRYKNLTIQDLVQLSNTIKGLTCYEIY